MWKEQNPYGLYLQVPDSLRNLSSILELWSQYYDCVPRRKKLQPKADHFPPRGFHPSGRNRRIRDYSLHFGRTATRRPGREWTGEPRPPGCWQPTMLKSVSSSKNIQSLQNRYSMTWNSKRYTLQSLEDNICPPPAISTAYWSQLILALICSVKLCTEFSSQPACPAFVWTMPDQRDQRRDLRTGKNEFNFFMQHAIHLSSAPYGQDCTPDLFHCFI